MWEGNPKSIKATTPTNSASTSKSYELVKETTSNWEMEKKT